MMIDDDFIFPSRNQETEPEVVSPERVARAPLKPLNLATYRLRVCAYLSDFLIILVPTWMIAQTHGLLSLFGLWTMAVLWMLYGTLLESAYGRGQTLGKRFFSLRVVTTSGTILTIFESAIRQVFKVLIPAVLLLLSVRGIPLQFWLYEGYHLFLRIVFTALLFFIAYDFSVSLIDPMRRSLHDYFSDTLVLKDVPAGTSEEWRDSIGAATVPFTIKSHLWIILPIFIALGFAQYRDFMHQRQPNIQTTNMVQRDLWSQGITIRWAEWTAKGLEIQLFFENPKGKFLRPVIWKSKEELATLLNQASAVLYKSHPQELNGKAIIFKVIISTFGEALDSGKLQTVVWTSLPDKPVELVREEEIILDQSLQHQIINKP